MRLGQVLLLQQLSSPVWNSVLLLVGPYRQGLGMKAVQFIHEALNRLSVLLGNKFWLFLAQPF